MNRHLTGVLTLIILLTTYIPVPAHLLFDFFQLLFEEFVGVGVPRRRSLTTHIVDGLEGFLAALARVYRGLSLEIALPKSLVVTFNDITTAPVHRWHSAALGAFFILIVSNLFHLLHQLLYNGDFPRRERFRAFDAQIEESSLRRTRHLLEIYLLRMPLELTFNSLRVAFFSAGDSAASR